MEKLEALIHFLFPSTLFSDKGLFDKYKRNDLILFRSSVLWALSISAIAYIGHYYLLDLPLDLQPRSLWQTYRFGMAGLCTLGFTYYYFFRNSRLLPYKLFATLISLTICYLQAKTILWYPEVPYLYAFAFVLFTAYMLRLSPFQFMAYSTMALGLEWMSLYKTGIDQKMLLSATSVTVFFGLMMSSINYFQLKVFIATEQLFTQQQQNIEQSIIFTQRLKSFLPKKIASRLDQKVAKKQISIHQAVDEVLRPQKKNIACLTCDIRGYTQKSKNDTSYILNSVIPLTKKESQIVEHFDGIPRKIGDMLFCYYDSDSLIKNIKHALLSAFEIAHQELEYNKMLDDDSKVQKQILLSIGEAIVGNIGGLDSAVEITAMGTPVNFISRLEDIVKTNPLRQDISEIDIIVSKEIITVLKLMNAPISYRKYDITTYDLTIKDFEEVTSFYTIVANANNLKIIKKLDTYEMNNTNYLPEDRSAS